MYKTHKSSRARARLQTDELAFRVLLLCHYITHRISYLQRVNLLEIGMQQVLKRILKSS